MVQADARAFLLWAFLLLTLPLNWLLAAACAALIHELGHCLMIWLTGGRVQRICFSSGGAVIDAEINGNGKELACALAGPVFSLITLTLCHRFPRLALCGAAQGIYNLLPVYPMDGGRILRCILDALCPEKALRILTYTENTVMFFLTFTAVLTEIVLKNHTFIWAIFAVFLLKRKSPCKQRRIGVQ